MPENPQVPGPEQAASQNPQNTANEVNANRPPAEQNEQGQQRNAGEAARERYSIRPGATGTPTARDYQTISDDEKKNLERTAAGAARGETEAPRRNPVDNPRGINEPHQAITGVELDREGGVTLSNAMAADPDTSPHPESLSVELGRVAARKIPNPPYEERETETVRTVTPPVNVAPPPLPVDGSIWSQRGSKALVRVDHISIGLIHFSVLDNTPLRLVDADDNETGEEVVNGTVLGLDEWYRQFVYEAHSFAHLHPAVVNHHREAMKENSDGYFDEAQQRADSTKEMYDFMHGKKSAIVT